MILVNGQPARTLPVEDRGLQYGDGLFETIRILHGAPVCWQRHRARLAEGCRRLGIPLPGADLMDAEISSVCAGVDAGVLKLVLTRGPGPRGYAPPKVPQPTRILQVAPAPRHPAAWSRDGVAVRLCTTRLARNPRLAGIKHLNRLEQVLARSEWEDEVQEGIMQDTEGQVVEGVMSNLFLVFGEGLRTPDLQHCGVVGITRARVMELAHRWGIPCRVGAVTEADLWRADGLFLTNTLAGIWPVSCLAGKTRPVPPLVAHLREALGLTEGGGRA
ncbi:aminodeoxychorismate lyase [Ectothiorhodospira mobilis]|uniref:aminodeoxychorismate lyase n=1 Tax=Ectothiorhodospira mobilis TaxID=195064 RepID=UPI00190806AA|nr:aminodeoxychorismate lyase [Ectothiorhodospira mobilis]MBK1690801.1 aminodeoxychorismate lyase [Ectothiorhodospira mobilis]